MIRRTQKEWQALFAEQAACGLSAHQFYAPCGLCQKYFSLRRKQRQGVPSPSLPALAPAFIRVQKSTVASAAPSEVAHAVLRHGRSELELHAVSPRWLADLLGKLA